MVVGSCSSSGEESILEVDESEKLNPNYYQIAPSLAGIIEDMLLVDTISHRIFLFTEGANTSIIGYDYKNHLITNWNPITNKISDGNICLGWYKNNLEIYVGNENKVDIYNADNLTLKESIRVFNQAGSNDDRYVSNVQFEEPNLLFVNTCNYHLGISCIDRETKQQISTVPQGSNCMGSISYSEFGKNEIGLISTSYYSENNRLFKLDRFDIEGNFLDNTIVNDSKGLGSWNFMRDGNTEYFISSRNGSLVSKADFSQLGTLPSYTVSDIITYNNGNKIYAMERERIRIYSFPSLLNLSSIWFKDIRPIGPSLRYKRMFIHGDKLFLICFDIFNRSSFLFEYELE